MTPRQPTAKQIRSSFERPTMWNELIAEMRSDPDPDPVVVFLRVLQPERKAA